MKSNSTNKQPNYCYYLQIKYIIRSMDVQIKFNLSKLLINLDKMFLYKFNHDLKKKCLNSFASLSRMRYKHDYWV